MVLPSDASSSCRTTEDERIRAAEADDDDDEPPPQVVDRDPSGRFIRYAEPLGKGAYKTVWRAFDEEEGVEVAWNQLRVDHLTTLDAGKLRSEVTLLSALRHPNVIRLYYAWTAPAANGGETVYFVTELMTSGTLKRYLRKTSGGIRPKFLKLICRQVLSGLSYLHNCHPPVIHRDLKCENIFVNGNTGEVKLGDLGLATVKPLRHVTSVIGTPEFMAPELYDEKYDEKVDVYAFGMCVLEMVTKDYPYSECTNQAQIYKKVTNGIKPLALDKIEQGPLRELIEACLRFNPEERPTAAELLHHPFL
ncbi:kinase-like domain-containing protein, partial [Thamnocephalis sphaerospora]